MTSNFTMGSGTKRALITSLMMTGSMIAACSGAQAQDISYTYVDAGILWDNFDTNNLNLGDGINAGQLLDDEQIGFAGRVSVGLPEFFPFIGFHIVGDYYRSDLDLEFELNTANVLGNSIPIPADNEELRIAGGVNFTVADRVSAYAELGYVYNRLNLEAAAVDAITGSDSASGFDIRGGVRIVPFEGFELNGFARYHPNGDLVSAIRNQSATEVTFESAEAFGLGFKYTVFGPLAISAEYEFGSVDRLRAGVRLEF